MAHKHPSLHEGKRPMMQHRSKLETIFGDLGLYSAYHGQEPEDRAKPSTIHINR